MLILRLTATCAFLIAFSFFITPSSAHNTTVVIDSATGGEFPSRRVELTDRHPAHPSISARANARKKMTEDGIDSSATASVSATQSIVFPDGNVGTTYGYWEIYAEVTGGSGRDADCGNYSGSMSEGAGDWTEDDYPSDHLSDASAESGSNVSNQLSQSADCDISI